MEDKILKQEVYGGEDIQKHTLMLIWKQSFGRMYRNQADLAMLSGLESLGHISQLIKFLGCQVDFCCYPSNSSQTYK